MGARTPTQRGQSPVMWWGFEGDPRCCSAGDGRPVLVSVARVVEEGHRGLGEVAAGDGPFVVLVGEDGSGQADRGPVVGEDRDHVEAVLHSLVQPLEGVVAPDPAPVRPRERRD